MKVCDKCLKNPVRLNIRFETKSFQLCKECALKIVSWLEKKPLKDQLGSLWDKTKQEHGMGLI